MGKIADLQVGRKVTGPVMLDTADLRALLDVINEMKNAHLERVKCRHRGECRACEERTDEVLAMYDDFDKGE